jgi:hypothetical protein
MLCWRASLTLFSGFLAYGLCLSSADINCCDDLSLSLTWAELGLHSPVHMEGQDEGRGNEWVLFICWKLQAHTALSFLPALLLSLFQPSLHVSPKHTLLVASHWEIPHHQLGPFSLLPNSSQPNLFISNRWDCSVKTMQPLGKFQWEDDVQPPPCGFLANPGQQQSVQFTLTYSVKCGWQSQFLAVGTMPWILNLAVKLDPKCLGDIYHPCCHQLTVWAHQGQVEQ